MTEPKRRPGRPAYTPDERQEASVAALLRSIRQVGECWVVKRDHFVNWENVRVRTRAFAWDHFHPDEPRAGYQIVKQCTMPKCVRHLARVELIDTMPVESAEDREKRYLTTEKGYLRDLKRRTAQDDDPHEGRVALMKFYADWPVPLDSPHAENRLGLLPDPMPDDEVEAQILLKRVGLIVE